MAGTERCNLFADLVDDITVVGFRAHKGNIFSKVARRSPFLRDGDISIDIDIAITCRASCNGTAAMEAADLTELVIDHEGTGFVDESPFSAGFHSCKPFGKHVDRFPYRLNDPYAVFGQQAVIPVFSSECTITVKLAGSRKTRGDCRFTRGVFIAPKAVLQIRNQAAFRGNRLLYRCGRW